MKFKFLIATMFASFVMTLTTSSAFAQCVHSIGTCTNVACGPVCCRTPQECSTYQNSLPNGTVFCPGNDSINTAIGCIPINDTSAFVGWILGWAIGVGGGIAFLLMVYASFMIMTSSGDPSRLKAGQETLTSAISGLIMLIFSVFILKFIGIDILGLDNL